MMKQFSAAVIAVCLGFSGAARAGDPPRFVYVDLGEIDPAGILNLAYAINDAGVATGVASFFYGFINGNTSVFSGHAFTAAPGEAMVDIATQPEIDTIYGSQGWDINNAGIVVGQTRFVKTLGILDARIPPVMWKDGIVISLGISKGVVPTPGVAVANAINDHNQIVGEDGPPGGEPGLRSFLWENGQMRLLDELGPFTSRAWDINNLGHITGEISDTSVHPYLVRDGEAFVLDTPGKGYAINDLDQIVGWPGNVWEGDKAVRLPSIPFSECLWPRDINNVSDIVGECTGGTGVLWSKGNVYNLNDLVQPSVNNVYYVSEVFGINNSGQIAGAAAIFGVPFQRRAFRLDPVTPDFDSDGVVTIQDLQQLLIVWGSATDPYIDLTGDGVVNSADLANLLANWGNVPVRKPYSWTKNAP